MTRYEYSLFCLGLSGSGRAAHARPQTFKRALLPKWLIGIEKVKCAIKVCCLADVVVGRTLLGESKLLLSVRRYWLVRVSIAYSPAFRAAQLQYTDCNSRDDLVHLDLVVWLKTPVWRKGSLWYTQTLRGLLFG